MNRTHLIALATLPLAVFAALPGTSAAQERKVTTRTISLEEFKQIHGTTDRYELMGMEVKGDCTQCHERRAEVELTTAPGYSFFQAKEGGETLRPYELLDDHIFGEIDFFYRKPSWGHMNFVGKYLGEKYHAVTLEGRYRTLATGEFTSNLYPHNSDHLFFPPPTSETPVPAYNPDDQDPGGSYEKDVSEQIAKFRVGPGFYPAHLQLEARRFQVKGDTQQAFLDENCTSNCHNISQNRTVNLTTAEVKAGADAHVGWGMVSYSFDYTELRDDENDPVHEYGAIPGVFPGGAVAHNTYPDMTSWEHLVTANTMMTGGLSAWGSFGLGRRRNEDSEIDRNYYRGLADAVWQPYDWASVAFKYRRYHFEEKVNSETAEVRVGSSFPVEPALTEDRYTGVVSLQPFRSLNVRADISHKEERRSDFEQYQEPENTRTDQWRLGLTYRPARRITLRGTYEGLRTEDEPAYPVTGLSDSTSWRFWATAQPWQFLLLQAGWHWTDSENRFSDFENKQNNIQLGFTVTPTPATSVGVFYAYFKVDADRPQDSIPSGDFLLVDDGMDYTAKGRQAGLQASWRVTERLLARAEASWIKADGSFDGGTPATGDLGDYSEFEATQKEVSLDAQYDALNGWGVQGGGGFAWYKEDDVDNDERVTTVRVIVSKRW